MTYLLDTNICIYALANRPARVLQRLREVGPEAVAVSVVTLLELRHGAENASGPAADHARLDAFLAPIEVLPFDRDSAELGGRLRAELRRAGRRLGDLDLLIAAQALAAGRVLVSNDLRAFGGVDGLRTANWAE
jgi:tRNA(fMet)-specific endonuclease VapC